MTYDSCRHFVGAAAVASAFASTLTGHGRPVLVHGRQNIAYATPAFGFAAKLPEQRADAPSGGIVAEALADVAVRQDVAGTQDHDASYFGTIANKA
jgi:hypothetical protein